jgi:hypothetical protein
MAEPFSVALLATPRAYTGGEAAFVFESGTGVIRSAVVAKPAAASDEQVDVRYCVPDRVTEHFKPVSQKLYAFSRVGIDEAVAATTVHPASEFEADAPASADGTIAAGSIVVFLRPALFRVALALVVEAVPPDAAPETRFATRLLEPDRAGLSLTEASLTGASERAKFVPVEQFAKALEASFDPLRENGYIGSERAAGG